MLKHLLSVLLVLTTLVGCTISPPVKNDPLTNADNPNKLGNIISWNDDLNHTAYLWLDKARDRFVDPVVFTVHGGYEFIDTQVGDRTITTVEWWVFPDAPRKKMSAQTAADTVANLYPDRDILFVVCNENGYELRTPRVFYAKQDIWTVPDKAFPLMFREQTRDFGSTGNIWEFVAYDGHDAIEKHIVDDRPTYVPTTQPTTQPSIK